MKILIWVSKFPTYSETFVRDHIIGLLNAGVDVYIHTKEGCFNETEAGALVGFESYTLQDRIFSLNPYSSSPKFNQALTLLKIIWMSFFDGSFKYYWRIFRAHGFKNLGRIKTLAFNVYQLLKYKIDVIHAHFGPNGNDAVIFKRLNLPLKLVTTFHGYDIRLGLEKGGYIYRDLFNYGNTIISISEYNTKHLIAFGVPKTKLLELSNGIDVDFFCKKEKNSNESKIKLLTVARLVPEKALDLAIHAVAELIKQNKELSLSYTIIGEGRERNTLQGLIRTLKMENHIHLVGAKHSMAIRDYMTTSDVFLLSSKSEALPTVLLEAQAAEMQVVATKVGAVKSILPFGMLVEPQSTEALKFGLNKIFENQGNWNVQGQKARTFIRTHYDIQDRIDKLVKFYST